MLDKISAARHRQPDDRRAQRARGNVEALARPRVLVARSSRPRGVEPKLPSRKKEPPGMSRGAMPPRRSRGGDDQRIAPARCQYAPRCYTAPAKIVSTSAALLKSRTICTGARTACILSRMPRPELARDVPQSVPRPATTRSRWSARSSRRSVRSAESRADAAELEALQGGAPDFGTIRHHVRAAATCASSSRVSSSTSGAFANDGIFYERAVNRILDDLAQAAKPRWMEVVGDFNIRGGIKSVITRARRRAIEGVGAARR